MFAVVVPLAAWFLQYCWLATHIHDAVWLHKSCNVMLGPQLSKKWSFALQQLTVACTIAYIARWCAVLPKENKKLSYRRGTARCVVSVKILPIATQQCRDYDKSWPNPWYKVGGLVGGNINHDATESLSLYQSCHKQTDYGRVVDITCIPTTCCGEIFKSTMQKLLTWPWPRPLREHSLITRLRLHMADPCTKSEVSSISRCGDITWSVKF